MSRSPSPSPRGPGPPEGASGGPDSNDDSQFPPISMPSSTAVSSASSRTPSPSQHHSHRPSRDPADRMAPVQAPMASEEELQGTSGPTHEPQDEIAEEANKVLEAEREETLAEKPGSRRRSDLLKVHWNKRQRGGESESEEEHPRQAARRMVRQMTGRSSSNASLPRPDEDAVSITSSASSSHHSHRRRRSNASGSEESSDGDDVGARPRGVLSSLLHLNAADVRAAGKGSFKALRQGRRRHSSLFSAKSSRSRSSFDSQPSSRRTSESEYTSDDDRSTVFDQPVRRSRWKNAIPPRSQDLNEPYIPSAHFSSPLTPAANVTIAQNFRRFVSQHASPATWFGSPSNAPEETATYRSVAALIITTTGLAGVASPTLAHIAPAAGSEAENSAGERKLCWYDGVAEGQAREEDYDMWEQEEQRGSQNGDEGGDFMEKALEEGRMKNRPNRKRRRGKRTQREMAITKHVANIIQRKRFIELLAIAVVNFGAPAHSVESWLEATADILQVDASFIYFPSVLIIAFRDSDVHSTDISFVRPKGGLELYRLSLVHEVYRRVVHDEMSAAQGCRVLRRITRRTIPYSRVTLILIAAIASATAAGVAFSGSFIDILMSGVLGSILAIIQFTIGQKHDLVSRIFEIAIAGILSFISRGLGSTKYFCYQSLASASIVLILPGWYICLGALELGSRNVVAGAIRIVWAIVYTLFLSFGLSIGSQIWDAFGPAQLSADDISTSGSSLQSVTIQGSFTSNSSSWDQTFNNGTFTFQNGTSAATQATTVACYRNPNWDYWWYVKPSAWWLFLLVPVFAFSLAIWFRAAWNSRDMLVMVVVASAGYVVNYFLSEQIDQTNVVSAVAAFTVGVLGNLYSRIGGGSAFPSMVVGILLEVPNAIAAAGGLSASSSDSSSDSSSSDTSSQINTAVIVSIRMVQVGIGLAIGLFVAALVVYPFGKKRRYIFSY
ncbi:hypothetical protein BCR39DRAFT_516439 [Naematelia encephala]|uniref:Threonine/serine exporter-like N-terminal domain-containing protein n=1 Tax=Naematelia encephala TaxID=71784 RepID=A0A1Y2BKB7_9TREE|nr:hypothetical protein BCR39DRAFT_516439 [Naematelia encephala]